MPCFCCPAGIIYPLAFGILASMEWMYKFIPNYGIVIIILVFLIRLVLHPLTKKSQVAMSKMGKLGPQVEEIKKKYGDNKAEMNKRVMALYKEQGASPILGMIPMFIQMPIWIALYSAIYASVSLRGAAIPALLDYRPFSAGCAVQISGDYPAAFRDARFVQPASDSDGCGILPAAKAHPDAGVSRLAGRTAAKNDDDYDAYNVPLDALQGAVRLEPVYYGKYLRGRY